MGVSNGVNYLANFMTYLSLIFGFLSIIFSLESQFTFSCWSILFSVVFDGLDGQIARRNPVPSAFGKELDSLVDVVSFGIAPAILGYVFVYDDFQIIAVIALFIYLSCSVFRLAKYNITPKDKMVNYFIGLPTTMSGALLASFVLIYRKKQEMILPEFVPDILYPQYTPAIFIILVLILSVLMVSKIKYLNLDGLKQLMGKSSILWVSIAILLLMEAILLNKTGVALFTIFLIYLIFSPFMVKRIKAN